MKKGLTEAMAELKGLLHEKPVVLIEDALTQNADGTVSTVANQENQEIAISLKNPDGTAIPPMFMDEVSNGSSATSPVSVEQYEIFVQKIRSIYKSDFVPIINNVICAQGQFATMEQLYTMAEYLFPTEGGTDDLGLIAEGAGIAFTDAAQEVLGDDWDASYSGQIATQIQQALTSIEKNTSTSSRMLSARGGVAFYPHNYIKQALYASGAPLQSLLTKQINAAQQQDPKKSATTMGYVQVIDPQYSYSVVESQAGTFLNTSVPPTEISRCVPYLNVKIISSTATARQLNFLSRDGMKTAPISPMSLEEFVSTSFQHYGETLNTGLATYRDPSMDLNSDEDATDMAPSGDVATPSRPGSVEVGMEAFTAPQTLVPIGQNPHAKHASIDATRPLMTLTSFKTKILPTRGAMTKQQAELSFVCHDRGRLDQLSDILRPATMNKVEFDIEYGWAHPDGDMSNNVYGKYLNSLRQSQVFSMTKSGYNFTDDGQVNITVTLVTKAAVSANETDASQTGKHIPGYQVLSTAYEALRIARSASGDELDATGLSELKGTQHLTTVSMNSTGNLLKADAQIEIQEWIDQTNAALAEGGLPKLETLKEAFDTFQAALGEATASIDEELSAKMKVITGTSYSKHHLYTHASLSDEDFNAQPSPRWLIDFNLNSAAKSLLKQNGSMQPLGLMLHLFLIKPLMSTSMYDEVQLITYNANTNAGAVAGVNLGAIPLDVRAMGGNSSATFEKVLKGEYKKWGGQYPVTRCIDFLNENFIKPQTSICYGLASATGGGNKNMVYNTAKGTVTMKEDSDPGKTAAAATKALRKIYYDGATGSEFEPAPTDFQPINLKIILEVGTSNADDLIKQGVYPWKSTTDRTPRTVLRVHVVDAAHTLYTGVMDTLKTMKKSTGGIIIPPVWRGYVGINACFLKACNIYPPGVKQHCEVLEQAGILKSMPTATTEISAEALEERKSELAEWYASGKQYYLANDPESGITPDSSDDELKAHCTKLAAKGDKTAIDWLSEANKQEEEIETGFEAEGSAVVFYLNSSPEALLKVIMKDIPKITYGQEGSMVNNISLASNVNSKVATTQMLRYMRNAESGGGTSEPKRGLPTRFFPANMSIDMLGNPMIKVTQRFFLDAATNTTVDNLYAVKSVEHTLTPREFKTSAEFIAVDAYSMFTSMETDQKKVAATLKTLEGTEQSRAAAATAAAQAREETRSRRAARSSGIVGVSSSPSGVGSAPMNGPYDAATWLKRQYFIWCIVGQSMAQYFAAWAMRVYGRDGEDWTVAGAGQRRDTLSRGMLMGGMHGRTWAFYGTGLTFDATAPRGGAYTRFIDQTTRESPYQAAWRSWGLIPLSGLRTWNRGYALNNGLNGCWQNFPSLTYADVSAGTDAGVADKLAAAQAFPMWGLQLANQIEQDQLNPGSCPLTAPSGWWSGINARLDYTSGPGGSTLSPWQFFIQRMQSDMKRDIKKIWKNDPLWGWTWTDHNKMKERWAAMGASFPPEWYNPPRESGVTRDG